MVQFIYRPCIRTSCTCHDSMSIDMWNQFRSDMPRTNNKCEGYNSRLSKRAQKSHLNIYALIVLFRDEQLNKKEHILQLEGGQNIE